MSTYLIRLARWLTRPAARLGRWPWFRMWLAAAEQQAKFRKQVRELTVEADFNARSVLRLIQERDDLRMELRLARGFAEGGYNEVRKLHLALEAARQGSEQ
jgi:hypothetical protein